MKLSRIVQYPFRRIGQAYIKRVCEDEFRTQQYRRINERPTEFAFVFRKLAEISPKTVLDVGTGKTALPHVLRTCGFLVTATDNVKDYWSSTMLNRHYHVLDDDITETKLEQKFDVITCVSVLEHIPRSEEAVNSMLSLLNPKGHLLLTFPYCEQEYVSNVYRLEGSSYGKRAPYVTQAYSRKQLDDWFDPKRFAIRDQEYWKYWDGPYWTVGNQILPPCRSSANELHQLTCLHVQAL